MESNLSDQSTAEYSKARAEFSREKLRQTRKQWYEKTASLKPEKDSSKFWNLAKVLNEEAPPCSKTVFCTHNKLLRECNLNSVKLNSWADPSYYMAQYMLHMMTARCVARDLHTIAPWPLERTCWRWFMAQWGDHKNLELCLSMQVVVVVPGSSINKSSFFWR